jgi:release factor glutamine methyltransferase
MTITIREAILEGVGSIKLCHSSSLTLQSARLDAEVLLAYLLGCSRHQLICRFDEKLNREQLNNFRQLINGRAKSQPIAYITGKKEFYGRDFLVTPAVLIPRPETEMIVDRAIEIIAERKKETLNVLELGVGSGCIILSLLLELREKKSRKKIKVIACDASECALDVARKNAQTFSLSNQVEFIISDWFSEIKSRDFDLILSNPPYVESGQAQFLAKDLSYEPQSALFAGLDGLDDIRKILAESKNYLVDDGTLLLEFGSCQKEAIKALAKEHSYQLILHNDLARLPRMAEFAISER